MVGEIVERDFTFSLSDVTLQAPLELAEFGKGDVRDHTGEMRRVVGITEGIWNCIEFDAEACEHMVKELQGRYRKQCQGSYYPCPIVVDHSDRFIDKIGGTVAVQFSRNIPTIDGKGTVAGSVLDIHLWEDTPYQKEIITRVRRDPENTKFSVRIRGKWVDPSEAAAKKGATAAGLTATAVKDEFGDGRWTLEAGALPLADRGVAVIDEIEKMDTKEQDSLLQPMEQQEVTIAKAGIVARLKTRFAMLAAANPTLGKFDPGQAISEQIKMSAPLLSRYDLIFTLRDIVDLENDRRLAEFIMKVHNSKKKLSLKPMIEPSLLRKFIAYSRATVFPELSPEAEKLLVDFYVSVRGKATDSKVVPITVRQLEALIRLAKAAARIRLSEVVSVEDARMVIALVEQCLKDVAYDEKTGGYDIGKIMTGTSRKMADQIAVVKKVIMDLADPNNNNRSLKTDIYKVLFERGFTEDAIERTIDKMSAETLIVVGPTWVKKI